MTKNNNLNLARKEKNDEFYTFLEDIERELKHYKDYFKDKIIYCNCDNPNYSNFWKYFYNNFRDFGLKKLISTYYSKKHYVCKTEYDGVDIKIEILNHNGDFRNKECIDLLKKSDIVVTNPPFSLFIEFITQLSKYDKKFIVIGNKNSVTSKVIFNLFMENKIKYGFTDISKFLNPMGELKYFGNISWFTNLDITFKNNKLKLNKRYEDNIYYKYENLDAINVDKIKDIPFDYYGIMGVPITFLEKDYYDDFEILGLDSTDFKDELGIKPIGEKFISDYFTQGNKGHYGPKMKTLVLYENGLAKVKYKRILIKRKDDKQNDNKNKDLWSKRFC